MIRLAKPWRAQPTLRTRGWQALWRETFYRLCLVFGKEPWQLRADVPLRKELRAQRHDALPRQPLISVVVPLYNTPPRYLKEMVASVRAQSYQNWELVLVDASDAPTGAAKLVARARDERVRYVHLAKTRALRPTPMWGWPRPRASGLPCWTTTTP